MIPVELVDIFAQLHAPETRVEGAARLARHSGVEQVLLFGKDQEIGQFLPARGLPQTLRQGARWQAFLQQCGAGAGATLPDPVTGADMAVYGVADRAAQVAVVFLAGAPPQDTLAPIVALLPLLGATLSLERALLAAGGHAEAARESNRRANALNAALDANRRELQSAYQRAEDELVSRRQAEEKLRDTDRRKDEFLAMLAHELRNPLAPISMAAQTLKIGQADPARVLRSCAIIDRQVAHMTRLLDDLLDVSRVSGGMVALAQEQCDMRALVDEAIEQAHPLIVARQHHLSLTLPAHSVPVRGDRTRLVQIVTNLVQNAAKYTPPGGEIGVLLVQQGDGMVLTVSDNGVGIDAQLLPHIFELFIQGQRSPDRSQGGLGLGLALVKSLAERHGGAVTAYSAGEGLGSRFELTLPCVPHADAPGNDDPGPGGHGDHPLSILIVDDNEDAAHTLALYLQALGHRVETAFNGTDALALAPRAAPDVLLLDIGLPDMDGYALASRLRQLPATRSSLLIALTGYGLPGDRTRSSAAGFDHHLTKPVTPALLAALLGQVKSGA